MKFINKKICILGNSVSLLVVPDRKNSIEKTYSELFEEVGYNVINSSKQATTLSDVFRYFDDEVIRLFPNIVIINYGIVEATYRTKPRWLNNYFSGNDWNNNIIDNSYCPFFSRFIRKGFKILYKPIGRIFFLLHLKWRFMTPKKFSKALFLLLLKLTAYTPVKQIIILGMLPIDGNLEKIAPGTKSSVLEYNMIMNKVCDSYEKAIFIDLSSIFTEKSELLQASIDSIHLTAYGHKMVFDKIYSLINGDKFEISD